MTESDGPPVRLRELSQVESPDVVRAALQHFRRRTLVRTGLILLVVFAWPWTLQKASEPPRPTYEQLLANNATTQEIGVVVPFERVEVAVLSARKIDEDALEGTGILAPVRALDVALTAAGIKPNEALVVNENWILSGRPGTRIRRPASERTAGVGEVGFASGARTVTFTVIAVNGRDFGTGPGQYTRAECALPFNELGVCELPKFAGRLIERITLDLEALAVDPGIWR